MHCADDQAPLLPPPTGPHIAWQDSKTITSRRAASEFVQAMMPFPMLRGRSMRSSLEACWNYRSSRLNHCTLSIPRRSGLGGVCASARRLPVGCQSCSSGSTESNNGVELVLLLHPGCPTFCALEIDAGLESPFQPPR